jgi:hypothetical protein
VVGARCPCVPGPKAFESDCRLIGAAALRLWRPLADQGNATVQNFLGQMYREGTGVPQDYAAAMSWYQKAADQGNAPAQFNLGFMYFNGPGVPQDYAAAMSWYRKAADQGNSAALSGSCTFKVRGSRKTMSARTCGSTLLPPPYRPSNSQMWPPHTATRSPKK